LLTKSLKMAKKIEWGNIPMKGDDTITIEQLNRIENGKNAVISGQLKSVSSKGGKVVGIKHYKNGTGLFGMSKSEKKKAVIKGGKVQGKINADNGHVSIAGKISAKSKKHPNNVKVKCEHCGFKTSLPLYKRWHGDKCKLKK
jgi:hypothetical protein